MTTYKHQKLECIDCDYHQDEIVPVPIEQYYDNEKENKRLHCPHCQKQLTHELDMNEKQSSVFDTPAFIRIHNLNNKLPSQFKEFQKEFKKRHKYAQGEQLKNW